MLYRFTVNRAVHSRTWFKAGTGTKCRVDQSDHSPQAPRSRGKYPIAPIHGQSLPRMCDIAGDGTRTRGSESRRPGHPLAVSASPPDRACRLSSGRRANLVARWIAQETCARRSDTPTQSRTLPDSFGYRASNASSATDHALRLPAAKQARSGDPPGFLGRRPLPRPMRCG